MDYEALISYMIKHKMCVSCPTYEDRKLVIDQIKSMKPDADILYMSVKYSSEDWPYALPKIDKWCLCVLGERTPISLEEFFALCGCSQADDSISVDIAEVI